MKITSLPPIVLPQTLGLPFEGGYYGGSILVRDKVLAAVIAPKIFGEIKGIWLPRYDDVPNAASTFDSEANTLAMAEAGSPLAKTALDLVISGVKGWCLPARDLLELWYRHLKPTTQQNCCSFRDGDNPSSVPPGHQYTETNPLQTAVETFRAGGSEAFEDALYTSSTQYSSSYAWLQTFDGGLQLNYYKKFEARARVVRMIQITP